MWQILQIIRNSQNAMNLIFILLFTFFFPKVHRTKERATKGQLVSEGLFVFFKLSQKTNKNFCPSRLGQKLTF